MLSVHSIAIHGCFVATVKVVAQAKRVGSAPRCNGLLNLCSTPSVLVPQGVKVNNATWRLLSVVIFAPSRANVIKSARVEGRH
jgi:hypothetical protein